MRAMLDFPAGFGSDPSLMLGPSATEAATSPPMGSVALAAPAPPAHVPGPFRARVASEMSLPSSFEGSGGFRPHVEETDESEALEGTCREPQSVVVTTMVVGAVLAAMGYFLDYW